MVGSTVENFVPNNKVLIADLFVLSTKKFPLLENSVEVQLNREDTWQVEPGGGGGEKEWTGIFGSVSESESSF